MSLSGACLCGSVRYEVQGELGFSGYCHCTRCRRQSGGAFQAAAILDEADFRITQGSELITTYEEEGYSSRSFCSKCGTPVYGKGDHFFVLSVSTLDDQSAFQPQFHVMVDYKAPWDVIGDDLPQYGEFPDL